MACGWLSGGQVLGVGCPIMHLQWIELPVLQRSGFQMEKKCQGNPLLKFAVRTGLVPRRLPYLEVACKEPCKILEWCLKYSFLIAKSDVNAFRSVFHYFKLWQNAKFSFLFPMNLGIESKASHNAIGMCSTADLHSQPKIYHFSQLKCAGCVSFHIV